MHKYSHNVMFQLCRFKTFHCADLKAKLGSKTVTNPEVLLCKFKT
jgi:hypothetical protein